MSKNINQVFTANPITSNAGTDLMYFGQSPYGASNDAAMLFSNFILQFPSGTWVDVTSGTQALAPNNGYVTDNGASLVTFTLPVTAAFGTIIEVAGKSAGGWVIHQNAGQQIIFDGESTTVGVGGSLASTLRNDYVKLLCITANTTWSVIGGVGNITVV